MSTLSTSPDPVPVPPDLMCVICKELISAAVMLPCCAGACCESCARSGITCFGNCPLCQDAVDMEDLIPYRMLRDRIDQYNDKVNKTVETSNENDYEVSEISAEQITFISSPSHPNNPEDDAGEEKNNEKVSDISLRSPTLSSVSSSPSLILSPVNENEANLGRSIPSLQSPRFTRQRHFSSSTAKFSSPWRGPSPHLSPVPKFLPRKAPLAENFKGINHTPVPPLSHLQPHNDTLAQFQEAMKNMEEQKRSRKLWQKHQQINNKKINIITHNPEELSPVRKRSKSHGDGVEDESRSSTPSPIRNCSAVSEGSFQLQGDYKKDNDEDGVKNSKHILCSGQIVQIPAAVAEIKKTKTSESREGSTLKKALDNMKFVEEERMRKLRENAVEHDSSSEPEETKLKKKKEKKKKRKKDKLEKAERKLRKLLKKKGLDKEVLAKILKKAKKKKSKKDMIELEDVSSPEPVTLELPQKPKISPIIERKIQHSGSDGNMQNNNNVDRWRREERNRERLRDEREREHHHDGGGNHHHPRRNASRDRSPPGYRSSFSVNSRNRHLDSYNGRLSRRRR